jgi:hypothetical protein
MEDVQAHAVSQESLSILSINLMHEPRSLAAISADLESLGAPNFDLSRADADGAERIHSICDELVLGYAVDQVAPLLLSTAERLEECDLGSPGPIVHTLEALPGYEMHLIDSFKRKPTALTAWMVNRIANADGPRKVSWVGLLRESLGNPAASPAACEEIRGFLEFQGAT